MACRGTAFARPGRLADLAAHRPSEVLEWILLLLIAGDTVLYFTPLR